MNRYSRASVTSSSSSTSGKLSTIWGPGTLSGKALEAIGEAALRGVENLAVRRKLASLRSIFPHSDPTTIGNIDQLYDDVLELSRPHLYPKAVGKAALRLIRLQIDSGETYQLIKGLDRWPEVEIRFFLSQLISSCLLDVEFESDDNLTGIDMRRKLLNLTKEALHVVPLINFIGEFARDNEIARYTAMDVGFLDMLLRIYVVFPTCYAPDTKRRARRFAVLTACQSTLEVLLADTLHVDVVYNHPVYDLWLHVDQLIPDCAPNTPEETLEARCLGWRRSGVHLIRKRLMTIWRTSTWSGGSGEDAEFQACIDIVEFSRQQYYDLEVINLALLTIFKYIVAGGNAVEYLTVILTRSSYLDTTHIMSEIMQLWLEYSDMRRTYDLLTDQTRLVTFDGDWSKSLSGENSSPVLPAKKPKDTFYIHERNLFFSNILKKQTSILPLNDTALSSIIHFVIFATQQGRIIQWGLLDAGALAVVLIAFVDGVPMLSDLLDAFKHCPNDRQSKHDAMSCISMTSIRAEAFDLLHTIQTPAFQVLLRTRIFTERRRICLPLLDALLGSGGGVDDMYSELRDVFEEILGI